MAWDTATEADVREAFDAHPRIGEAERGGTQERREQSASADADDATREALREGNRAYECALRAHLPRLRERPVGDRAAGEPAVAAGQRPGDRARDRRRGAAQDHAAAAAEARDVTAVTTHVLDTARGLPARGVRRDARGAGGRRVAARSRRRRPTTTGGPPAWATRSAGTHRLVFATGPYLGDGAFFPEVSVVFEVRGEPNLHVPLLLAPHGYTTYRGS